MDLIQEVLEIVKKRNPNEREFLQAVTEVLESELGAAPIRGWELSSSICSASGIESAILRMVFERIGRARHVTRLDRSRRATIGCCDMTDPVA